MKRILLPLLALLVIGLLPAVLAFDSNTTNSNEWLMSGRTLDNSRYTPDYGIYNFSDVKIINFSYGYISRPLYAGAVENGYVYGVDWNNGAGHDGFVYKLKLSDLSQVANFSHGGYVTSPVSIGNGYLYFGKGTSDNYIYQLNSTDLTQVANFSTPTWAEGSPYIVSNILVMGTTGGGGPGIVFALDAADVSNQLLNFTASDETSGGILVNGFNAYFGSYNDYFYQISVLTGLQINNLSTTGNIFSQPAYYTDGVGAWVYFGTQGGTVYQVNASNVSQIVHTYTTTASVTGLALNPNLGYLYVNVYANGFSGDNKTYQLNLSDISQKVAEFSTPDRIFGPPAVNDYYEFLIDNGGNFFVLNASNVSQQIYNYSFGEPSVVQPVILNGTVLVGTDYHLYELSSPIPVSGCRVINLPGVYSLDSSIVDWSGYCINITNTDGVELNCNGWEIQEGNPNVAVYISGSNNVDLNNCSLKDGSYVQLVDSTNVSVNKDSMIAQNIDGIDCTLPYVNTTFYSSYSGSYQWCSGDYSYNLNLTSAIFLDENVFIDATDVYANGNDNKGFFIEPVAGKDNMDVSGLDATGFQVGVFIFGNDMDLINLNLHNNTLGIFVIEGNGNIIQDSILDDNDRGALIAFVSGLDMINNTVINNGYGITAFTDAASLFLGGGFEVIGNTSFGMAGFLDSQILNNSFINNLNAGFAGAFLGAGIIVGNNFSNNRGFGAVLAGDDMNVSDNIVLDNKMTGMVIGGQNVVVEHNTIMRNGDGVTTLDNYTLTTVESILSGFGIDLYMHEVLFYNGMSLSLGNDTTVNQLINNTILDNWNYGVLIWDNAEDTDFYYNLICNNSASGLNLSQISSMGVVFNADTGAPYYNVYCDNNPQWFDTSARLNISFTPADSSVQVSAYPSGEIMTPLTMSPGYAEYYLPQYYVYNGTTILLNTYQYNVTREGYVAQRGLVTMSVPVSLDIALITGFNPKIVCPFNSTSSICQVMSESGAGLGSFLEYLGGPLMFLMIVLIMIAIIAIIGYSISQVIKERLK